MAENKEKNTPISVIAVAHYFLQKSYPLSLLRVLKLCYISYGYVAGMFREQLFAETITTRRYGPSIAHLYDKLTEKNQFQLEHIQHKASSSDAYIMMPNSLEGVDGFEDVIDPKYKEVLDFVHERYAHLGGVSLSALTHQEGTPYKTILNKEYESSPEDVKEIPYETIEEYFYKFLN